MALLETLILGVGSGIARGIFNFWWGDRPVGKELGKAVIDVVKKQTEDVLAQRSAARQFERISEKVAQGVLDLFERQGADLDEDAKLTVAKVAGEVINDTDITTELLAEYDLDPARLARHLQEANRAIRRQLSETEAELYDRVISDASQYIVDIASQLPSFDERTVGEVLKRETLLIEKADRILDEVRRIREGTEDEDAKAAAFEAEYRRAVVRRLDRIELFGVDVSSASKRYKLSVAYITLAIQRETRRERDIPERAERGGHPVGGEDEEDTYEIVPADVAVAGTKRLFIRGDPGSGKTTLLQWVGVRAALRDMETTEEEWGDKVPFFIRLREFAGKPLPAPETFPSLVAEAVAGTMPNAWVHRHLKEGRGVVLIDGLDEVPEDQYDTVKEWIGDLVAAFPHARFIVTSRPHAAEEGWLDDHDFSDAELQEMDPDDIDKFLEHWHAAVKEELRDKQAREELDDLERSITAVVRKSRAIRRLATSPLLCAMLCALHRDRVKNLPSDRIELYRACCDMFLRRDYERRVSLEDYPQLGTREKLTLLQDFAYWLIKNGWSQVPKDQADKRFDTRLRALERVPKGTTGQAVRKLFVHRTGFLRHPTAEAIDFAHRTFQEFLAAQAALDEGDLGLLTENAHLEAWREVVILAAGLARPPEAKDLIKALIERGDEDKSKRHQLHVLAVACLETPVQLDASVTKLVKERLKAIVPPRTMTDAKALASAGELVVPFLAYVRSRNVREAAACVRTLAMVGGEEALKTLEKYVPDSRDGVRKALFDSRKSANSPDDYARCVLQHVSRRAIERRISFARRHHRNAPSVNALALHYSDYITDLSLLAPLKDLALLRLHSCEGITDLSPLGSLSGLTSLYLLRCSSLIDLSPLASLANLTSLELEDCQGLAGLSSLAALTNLTSLKLEAYRGLTDLSALAGLTNLTSLSLLRCARLTDLSPLARLANLTSLGIDWCERVTDLSPLSGLKGLTALSLGGCVGIMDVSPLANLTNLTSLALWGCERLTDLSPLVGLTKLERLFCFRCPAKVPSELRGKVRNQPSDTWP